MWSSARSEASLEASFPLPIEIRRLRTARRLRLRFDEVAGTLKLTCPWRTSRRAALAWALDQRDWIEAQVARAEPGEPLIPGATIPLEGCETLHRLARGLATGAAASCRRASLRRARGRSGAAGRSLSEAAMRATSCHATLRNSRTWPNHSPLGHDRRRFDALGKLLLAGQDPDELAADLRSSAGPTLRRGSRGRRTLFILTMGQTSRRSKHNSSGPGSPRRKLCYAVLGRGCDGSA